MCPSYSDVRLIESNLWGVRKGRNHSWLVADPGEGPGGPGSLLILDQTEAQKAEKKLFEIGSLLSQGLDDPPPNLSKGLAPPLLVSVLARCPSYRGVR